MCPGERGWEVSPPPGYQGEYSQERPPFTPCVQVGTPPSSFWHSIKLEHNLELEDVQNILCIFQEHQNIRCIFQEQQQFQELPELSPDPGHLTYQVIHRGRG